MDKMLEELMLLKEGRIVPHDTSHCQLQKAYLPSHTYGSGSAGKTSYKGI